MMRNVGRREQQQSGEQQKQQPTASVADKILSLRLGDLVCVTQETKGKKGGGGGGKRNELPAAAEAK